MGNLSKNIINEIAGQAVNKVFVTMATAVGFPEATLIRYNPKQFVKKCTFTS